MIKIVSRIVGMILGSVCLSIIPMLLFGFTRRPKGRFFRRVMRGSFSFYSSIFTALRPYVIQYLGIDILKRLPRILMTGSLSFGIVWGILSLLGMHTGFWIGLFSIAHGLFVGWQWQRIILPEDFQMGARIE